MKLNILAVALCSLVLFSGSVRAAESAHEGKSEEKEVPLVFPQPKPDHAKAVRPAQAVLVEPKALSIVTTADVTLKWDAVPNADHYVLQVATDPNFKWPVFVDWNHKDTSYEVKGLQKGQLYFWRVAGVKEDNNPGYTQGFYTSSSFEAK